MDWSFGVGSLFSNSDLKGSSGGGTDWGFDSNRSKNNWLGGAAAAFFSPSLGSYLSAAESRQAQEYAMQQQHDWQVAENERDRQFQREFWREQFEAVNDYSYLAAKLRAAGINPSAYFGKGDVSPSSPSGGSPSRSLSPSGFAGAVGGSGPSFFSTIAQMMDSASKIKSTNLAEERQKATLQAEVNKLLAEASNQSSNAEFIDTQNQIKKLLGFTRESYEILKLNNEAYAASARGDYDKAAELNQRAMAKVNEVEASTKEELKPILIANQQKLGKVYESERDKNVAQANEANAGAERNKAEARHSSAQAEYQEFSNRMRNEFKQDEYNAYVDKLWRDDMLSRAEYEEAKRRADVIKNSRRNSFTRALDNGLEYLKEKVSIFK